LTERRRRVVALYCPGWPPRLAQNGIVSYIGNLRPGLERAGVTARVLTGVVNSDSDEDRGAVDLADASPPRALQALVRAGSRRLPFHPLGVLLGCSVARGLEEIKRRHGLDLFEMEESFGVPMYVQQLVDVPVVVRLHGPRFVQGPAQGLPIDDEFHRIDRSERRCIAGALGITAPSLDVLSRVRRKYGFQLPHAVVIPNPVPVIASERRWSLAGCDRKTILFVGRFDRHKGGDLAIDAFQKIAPALPDAQLVFVGPDHLLRSEGGRIETMPQHLDAHVSPEVRARIQVLGALPADRIEVLRRQAYLTVVPSRYENFPLALAEALAFGCPTIAADAGGMPEILVRDRTGLLFRAGDAGDLARQIGELFNQPQRAAALAHEAAEDVTRRLSPDLVARSTLAYYEEVLARRRPRRTLSTRTMMTRAIFAFTKH